MKGHIRLITNTQLCTSLDRGGHKHLTELIKASEPHYASSDISAILFATNSLIIIQTGVAARSLEKGSDSEYISQRVLEGSSGGEGVRGGSLFRFAKMERKSVTKC